MKTVEQNLISASDLTSADLNQTLGYLFQHQLDYADLYFQSSVHETWVLEDGLVKEGSFNIERGVGVRAISGEKTGFAYADDISAAALQKAASAARGIAAAQPGNRLGDIGAAIGQYARGRGYGMLADHGGHGIGREMHEGPDVPNEGRAGKGFRLRPGLVIAIEPMLIADGTDDYRHDADGWTLRTVSGARAAHSEHTVAITEDGPVIMTR